MALPTGGAGRGSFVILTREGDVLKFVDGARDGAFNLPAHLEHITWPAQVFASGDYIVVVDGESRRAIGLDPVGGQMVWQVVFRFPGFQGG